MKPEALQKLMRHKSYKTTLGYINLANQIEEAVADMPVPEALKQEKKDAAPQDATTEAQDHSPEAERG